jgi:hypothetical protein
MKHEVAGEFEALAREGEGGRLVDVALCEREIPKRICLGGRLTDFACQRNGFARKEDGPRVVAPYGRQNDEVDERAGEVPARRVPQPPRFLVQFLGPHVVTVFLGAEAEVMESSCDEQGVVEFSGDAQALFGERLRGAEVTVGLRHAARGGECFGADRLRRVVIVGERRLEPSSTLAPEAADKPEVAVVERAHEPEHRRSLASP